MSRSKQRFNLSVSEVAGRTGVAVSALHFYERKGLIASLRTSGNQRRYSRDVIRRISVIRAAQRLGLTLKEIAEAFATMPADRTMSQRDWERVATGWRTALDRRIEDLIRLRDGLTGCIGCGCLSMKTCLLLNEDDHLAQSGPGPVLLRR
jgi:MerR family transcriptional regulator, redox-sensitive transcriptional activator SoxR